MDVPHSGIHGAAERAAVTPGDTLNLGWGPGKSFLKGALNVGVVGYAQWQTTKNRGSDVRAFRQKAYERAYAVGPEVDFTLQVFQKNFAQFVMRYEVEFGARATTQGQALFGAISLIIP